MAKWVEGSFLDNLNAGASALGFQNADIAFGLAGIPWESRDDRTAFLNALTQVPRSEAEQPPAMTGQDAMAAMQSAGGQHG